MSLVVVHFDIGRESHINASVNGEHSDSLSVFLYLMLDPNERTVLRAALKYDAFDYSGDFLSCISLDSDSVLIRHWPRSEGRHSSIPRRPLLKILDDLDDLLRGGSIVVERTYSWGEFEPVEISFEIEKGSDIVRVRTGSHDRDGLGYLDGLLGYMRDPEVLSRFQSLRPGDKFSWWSVGGLIEVDMNVVKIWADYDADEDDFITLSRGQFAEILSDYIDFNGEPVHKIYDPV